MEQPKGTDKSTRFEVRSLSLGLILCGLAIAITGVSYIGNMLFDLQWLVWVVGLAFVAVGLLTMVWPVVLRKRAEPPRGRLQLTLLVAIPLAFVVSSQVCGLGLRACNGACHAINLALIGFAVWTSFRLYRNQPIGALLLVMIVISLIPHCVCLAPINTLWHSMLADVAPTCEMMPMTAALFSVAALRGIQTRSSIGLISILFVVMVFIIAGGLLFGFPWQGCVDHPGVGV
jgi:hypothetical protein